METFLPGITGFGSNSGSNGGRSQLIISYSVYNTESSGGGVREVCYLGGSRAR